MIRLKHILYEDIDISKKPWIIFVGGLTKKEGGSESISTQANRVRNNVPDVYNFKTFKWQDLINSSDVLDFIQGKIISAVILYSKSCEGVNKILSKIEKDRVYCIEPWNDENGSMNSRYTNVNASNLWRHPNEVSRGAGITGNDTPSDLTHANCLDTISNLIISNIDTIEDVKDEDLVDPPGIKVSDSDVIAINSELPEDDLKEGPPGWKGTKKRIEDWLNGAGVKLKRSSEKRPKRNTSSGNISDHYDQNPIAYAIDLAVPKWNTIDGKELGDSEWKKLRDWACQNFGISKTYAPDSVLYRKESWFVNPSNTAGTEESGNGAWINFFDPNEPYRYQLGWNTYEHFNHIHIGVRFTRQAGDGPVSIPIPDSRYDIDTDTPDSDEEVSDESDRLDVSDTSKLQDKWDPKLVNLIEYYANKFNVISLFDTFKVIADLCSQGQWKLNNDSQNRYGLFQLKQNGHHENTSSLTDVKDIDNNIKQSVRYIKNNLRSLFKIIKNEKDRDNKKNIITWIYLLHKHGLSELEVLYEMYTTDSSIKLNAQQILLKNKLEDQLKTQTVEKYINNINDRVNISSTNKNWNKI